MSTLATDFPSTPRNRWIQWLGWAVSFWPVFVVVSSATWKLTRNAWYVMEFGRIGWPVADLNLLAFLQLGCIFLYLIPRTAGLGAILLTGYLGGAIASYVRIGEPNPVLVPLSTAIIAWIGLWIREPKFRAVLPFRQ